MGTDMTFTHRTVLVTGAAGNLGRAVARAFEQAGANRVLVDLNADALGEAFGTSNERQLIAPTNLLDPTQVDATVKAAIERFRRIDVLVNLTGGFRMGDPVYATPDATWDFLFDINVRTLVRASHSVVPHMLEQGGGKIVNVGAYAAQKGTANMGAYGAAKGAVIHLTEAMAAELRERNINVNCVLPTIIDTPENRKAMPNADPDRWVAPDDLAGVIVFLASDAARAIHGAALPVTALS
jgi:NAD(P)-dependent dehydrogenase (short-subunit alcohol dehydrogenase family)